MRAIFRRQLVVPLLVFFLILSITTVLFIETRENWRLRQAAEMDRWQSEIARGLETHLATRLGLAEAIRQRWLDGRVRDETDFRAETDPILELLGDFQAINWVDRDGVIRWVSPEAGNEAARDLDLRRLPIPGAALTAAARDRAMKVTPPLELAQGGLGIVAYFPLYAPTGPDGFLNVVFRAEPLIQGAVGDRLPEGYRLTVRDGGRTLHGGGPPASDEGPMLASEVRIGDRTWTLELISEQPSALGWVATAILLGGLLTAIALAGLIFRLIRSRQSHEDSERRFHDFARISSDWFWETDAALRFSYLSDRFETVTGVASDRLIGKTREEVGAPGASKDALDTLLRTMRDHGEFRDFRHHRDRPDGERVYLTISGTPTFDENGVFLGYRGIGRDISALVRRQHSLDQALREAELASASKSSFLATMSHEFRTPLNAILGFSQVLASGKPALPGRRRREYAQDIHDSGAHLLSLVNDILAFSELRERRDDIPREQVDLAETVANCITQVRHQAAARGVRIRTQLSDDSPHVLAQPRALFQVLLNLLSNAVKFTAQDGHVEIRSQATREGMVITVRDTGIGIAEEDLKRITEPFVTVRDGTLTAPGGEGTGLGLSIVQELMTLHGGALRIESTLGEGTTATVLFPNDAGDRG